MKVAIVSRYPRNTGSPRGGVESVTVALARALAENPDVEVNVITVEKDQTASESKLEDGISVHRLHGSRWPQIADLHGGPSRLRIEEKLAEIDPDIVHWHETWGLSGSPLKYPQIFTVHGFDSENVLAAKGRWRWPRSRIWKLVESRGFKRHQNLISITPYVKKKIEPLSNARIHEIDNPLDQRFFSLEHLDDDVPRVLCVGWINQRKNTLMSVKAFAGAIKQGCKGKLVLAGAAGDEAYYQSVLDELEASGVREHVEIPGHVDHDRLAAELGRASVLLLPSLQENAPMAIAEAMAAGVPVITSNRCGMPYMIDEGRTGYLIDPLNCDEITDRLIRLLGSESERKHMGREGELVARERFHPGEVARRTINVYREIINEV